MHYKVHKNSPKRYAAYVGARLNQRKVMPDEWQRKVLSSTSSHIIMNTSRQVGKSTVVAALAMHKALFTPGSTILFFAPTEKQVKELFAKVSRFHLASGGEINAASVRKLGIDLENGSRLMAMPATRDSSRGFSPDLVIVDEAAYCEDEFYESILPSLAVSQGNLVLTSTPYGRRGFFYDEWVNGGPHWEKHEVPASSCRRIPDWFLDRERLRGLRYFQQEYNCQFVETEEQYFGYDLIEAAQIRNRRPIFGAS